MKPPWYFECGWWSPWCFLDEWAHRIVNRLRDTEGDGELPGIFNGICTRHNAAVERHFDKKMEKESEE